MKELNLTFMQRVRITLLVKSQSESRKDPGLRMMRDIRKRFGIPNGELDRYVRSVGEDKVMLATEEIAKQPDMMCQLTPSEAHLLTVKLDGMRFTLDDLDIWAEDLFTKLEAVSAEG